MIRFVTLAFALASLTACFDDGPVPSDTGDPVCIDESDDDVVDYFALDTCIAGRIGCEDGTLYFEDSCGCGCAIDEESECIDPDAEDVLQYMPLEDCTAALVGCDAGGEYFEDACGCGCLLD